LGFIDGLSLAVITRLAYAPPYTDNRYPQLVYTIPILINTAPIFIFCVVGVFTTFSWDSAFRTMLVGAIPITIMAIITHYFAGSFLEFADWLVAQKASRQPSANLLSLSENKS
jgi:hypothetical protein